MILVLQKYFTIFNDSNFNGNVIFLNLNRLPYEGFLLHVFLVQSICRWSRLAMVVGWRGDWGCFRRAFGWFVTFKEFVQIVSICGCHFQVGLASE